MTKVPAARRTALIALAFELGGRALATEVTLAADDPENYLRKFRKRMANIGVDEPQSDLAWLAITEGMTDRKVACMEAIRARTPRKHIQHEMFGGLLERIQRRTRA